MKRALALLGIGLAVCALAACGPPRWEKIPEPSPADAPQYGGELNIGTMFVTLSALSWDPADWTWKASHDTGMVREQLFAADMSHAVSRGGPLHLTLDAYIPPAALRGELAERWHWEDPLTFVVELRHGVMFPDKPGVMKARELEAEDVVQTFNYINTSPRKIATYYDFVDRVEARDAHTVVFHLKEFNAELEYRFGYGYYSGIIPREALAVDQRDWRNVTGTGPFMLDRYLNGNVQSFKRNPDYWDTEKIGGREHQLPYVDRVTYRIIKDEANFITALRTGKLDMLEAIRWTMARHLMESTPELQWNRRLYAAGTFIALRTDQPPLNDVRVRRALNMALDRNDMLKLLYEGQGELMAFPQHPDFGEYFQPLSDMPASVQEQFTYNPEKARALLAEAGFADGFDLNIQVCACNPGHMDGIPLIADYWRRIGVRTTIQPLEYAAFLSAMTTRTHGPAYMMDTGHVNPTTTLRKNFMTGSIWNAAAYSNPQFDADLNRLMAMHDEGKRLQLARELTVRVMDDAPYVWLPTPYLFTAWWPWVRNYAGELNAGAARPGPVYARIWIDHELKHKMGFE
ncbi:MAG TPA: ABC transporter substrate-binding protein [Povalibacter sp.]|uniref:ABC transporter substrate-binding protein n=1 Tax=Povalibacter sp. TaxID=1962978 RepID=UPI002CAAC229|nr:ABC transporter substrate-binding protein [Povalibacter sp.]HMN47075.1 ABC transporter substrate-binding protein [Povalibacter sp.]